MAQPLPSGTRVRIREDYPVGHFRTPVFVRGKVGTVTRKFGDFGNPEVLSCDRDGPTKALYEVRFKQTELWPDYAGSPYDTLDIDIYEHWLETI